ncbi:MAG: hypothetical protein IKW03_07650 [Clostridia bacterium]|nr:hypothetical protein [Clostridia bacterium]
MKAFSGIKNTVVAVIMTVLVVLSAPVDIVSVNGTFSSGETDNSEKTGIINLNAQDNSTESVQPEAIIPTYNTDDYKAPETKTPEGTAIKPEDILPGKDAEINQVPSDNDVSHDGTIVVPALLNNIMRDSLSTTVSKKVYTFTADERGAVVYAFNHNQATNTACLWYITLYEEYSPDGTGKTTAYRELNRLSYEYIGRGVQSSTIGVLPGNYRLVVECVSGHTADKYDVLIGFTATNAYETECNDSHSRYTHLPLNKTLNGGASIYSDDAKDTDCYLFRITDDGYTVFYFDHEEDAEGVNGTIAWRITLEDTDGNEYFYATSEMSKTSINSGIMGLPKGYYYLTVYSHNYSRVGYSVNVSFTKDDAVESEPNDTRETADIIELNTEKVGSLTYRSDKSDRDWFTFEMKKNGFVVLDFIHEGLVDDKDGWNIRISSEDGRVAYSTVSEWNQAVLQSPSIGLEAGRYYISIDSDNLYHNPIVYRLILMSVDSADWETEPNNDPETADIISIGETVNGTMVEMGTDFDKDYFAIDIETAGKLNVAFGHVITEESGKEGWVVSIVNSEGYVVQTVSSDWDSKAVALSADVKAGRYYILVETGLYFNTARYMFITSLE